MSPTSGRQSLRFFKVSKAMWSPFKVTFSNDALSKRHFRKGGSFCTRSWKIVPLWREMLFAFLLENAMYL